METRVISGNEAIAQGVRLSRVEVIPIYPITPQTTIAEYLASLVANGELEAEVILIDGEHSAMSACYGAELIGARAFTATCSHGLAYMHEPIAQVTAYRLPILMAVTNRRLGSLHSSQPDYTDTMPEKDSGWMQFYLESNQEALDMVIQAYRIAEDNRVILPTMICIDGFYLSYSNEPVEIPNQKDVDEFLPSYKAEHIIMDPNVRFETPLLTIPAELIPTYERLYCDAMERAKKVIVEVDKEFEAKFGRSYGGLIEQYRCENAEAVIITMGSMTTAARRAIDKLRKDSKKIGLIKVRSFRPFPTEEIIKIAESVDSIGVVDRAVSRGVGGGGGPLFVDVKAAIYNINDRPVILNFITGLFGKDLRIEDFENIANKTLKAAKDGKAEVIVDFMEDLDLVRKYCPPPNPTICMPEAVFCSGLSGCVGCGLTLSLRHTLEVLGKNTVMAVPSSCAAAIIAGAPFTSPIGVPHVIANMPSPGGVISGMRRGLRIKKRSEVNVIGFCGDGATVDIGFTSLSGAAERGESVIWLCYDNEAYMNTGIQQSGSTPIGAWTTTSPVGSIVRGKKTGRKNIPLIMALHGVPYIATASLAYIKDFRRKLKKASETTLKGKGMAYIHVQTPCPPGWRFPSEKTIEISRLAVLTGAWPLYEIEDGNLKINTMPRSLKPIYEYLKLQGRFRHLKKDEINMIQNIVNKNWKELLRLEQTYPKKMVYSSE